MISEFQRRMPKSNADTGIVSIRFDEAGQGTGGSTAPATLVDGFTDWKMVNHVVIQDGKAIYSEADESKQKQYLSERKDHRCR